MTVFTLTVTIGATVDAGVSAARRAVRRRTIRASVSRMVNMMMRKIEPADEKSPLYREQVPGLTLFADIGGEFRGAWWTGSRLFGVFGSSLYELFENGDYTLRGSLFTDTGPVDFAQGLFQLVCVDGPNGYVYTLASDSFARIGDPDFYGSERVSFLDGRWIFQRPDTQQFYWTQNIDDATTYDALDFASGEYLPDNIVAAIVDHRELWLLGEYSTEVWLPVPSGDQVYQRNNGAVSEFGCAATHTAKKMDNTIFWLGQDKNGKGMVYMAGGSNGYQPVRVSTQQVEEAIRKSTDIASSRAFTYQDDGQTFYCLNVPDLETTWVYDVSVGQWHERAELVNGSFTQWRALDHVFAFGLHLVGDADGKLYELDPYEYTNDGDILPREIVTPHTTAPSLKDIYFGRLRINVTMGQTSSGINPVISMRYSDDGGEKWSSWMDRSLGQIGQFGPMPTWHRLGKARDRVWHFRCTDNAKCSIVSLDVEAQEALA